MIKPGEVSAAPTASNDRQARIERYFDGFLSKGILTMNYVRGGWLKEDVDAVLEKYRAAGWTCEDTGRGFAFSGASPDDWIRVRRHALDKMEFALAAIPHQDIDAIINGPLGLGNEPAMRVVREWLKTRTP